MIEMEIGWDDRLWAIAVPLIIVAANIVGRTLIHVIISLKAAAWWNRVMKNSHDARHDDFEKEHHERNIQQDAAMAAAISELGLENDSALLFRIGQELTRMRERLDVMRIEDHARYEATSARSQFSDLRIVWLWARNCGNPKLKLDGGTTRRFADAADPGPDA